MLRPSSRATEHMRRSSRSVLACGVAAALLAGAIAPASASASPADPAAEPETGTVTVLAGADAAAEAGDLVAALSLREKAASLVMGHIPTTDPAALTAYMAQDGIGGFILMGANIPPTEAELRALTDALTDSGSLPPLIAVDQEGGDVARLAWDAFPSALTLKDAPADATRDAFAGRAALLERAGIGVNFGVVADVTPDPAMFIYRRELGTTPAASSERVAAAVVGEGTAVMSTLKHFPGHGAAPGDSHGGIPTTPKTRSEWDAADAAPFAAGIDQAAPILMFGHLAYTSIDAQPATLSAEWHRIAREDLGFDGIAITDDLGMLQGSGIPAYADPVANAVAAIAAGNDMVLAVAYSTPESAARIVDGLVAAVEAGALAESRIDEAAARVAKARIGLAASGRAMLPCADCAPVD